MTNKDIIWRKFTPTGTGNR